jgi:hypothetical protein
MQGLLRNVHTRRGAAAYSGAIEHADPLRRAGAADDFSP